MTMVTLMLMMMMMMMMMMDTFVNTSECEFLVYTVAFL